MGSSVPAYVIDDDPAMLESTLFLLGSLGIDATGFLEPLDFLKELGSLRAGCVLSDYSMPSMTGAELHRALLGRNCSWPVVLMSGNRDRHTLQGQCEPGIAAYLEKPFTVGQLLDALNRASSEL